jgi:hypothetical protein
MIELSNHATTASHCCVVCAILCGAQARTAHRSHCVSAVRCLEAAVFLASIVVGGHRRLRFWEQIAGSRAKRALIMLFRQAARPVGGCGIRIESCRGLCHELSTYLCL